jgi:hypothetical protein
MTFGASDVIAFKELNTGGNSAGNGGDGYNFGDLKNYQTAVFEPHNKAYGSDVDVTTGDDVRQKAKLDLDDGSGGKDWDKKKVAEDGGKTSADLSQDSESGHNESKVWADTTAIQENWAKIDQSANLIAGNGGNGGDDNLAKGGDVGIALVHTNPSTEITYTELKDVLNHSEHFGIDDFLHA